MTALRLTTLVTVLTISGVAAAQPAPPAPTPPPSPYNYPDGVPPPPPPPPEDAKTPKEPKAGDFNAGGQLRFPNGPDEMGEYATFNWVAFDARGKYYLLPSVTIGADMPLAVKKPETIGGPMGADPRMIGGMKVTLDAKLPKMDVPFAPKAKDSEVGLLLTGLYMRQGAVLLSEKDFPLFVGDFKPGFGGGLTVKAKVSTLVDFSLVPVVLYQTGDESITALQIPMSTILKVGSLLKLSADVGVFTGDDFKFGGSSGGRISLGAAIDVKIGRIVAHAGTGFASLLTGADTAYPTIGDSLYIDLNAKFVK